MNKKEFVEAHCEKGTTEDEQELYWWYFRLGRLHTGATGLALKNVWIDDDGRWNQ